MRYVAVGEEVTVVADTRDAACGSGAMDGAKFPKCVVVADLEIRRFDRVFQILGLLAGASRPSPSMTNGNPVPSFKPASPVRLKRRRSRLFGDDWFREPLIYSSERCRGGL